MMGREFLFIFSQREIETLLIVKKNATQIIDDNKCFPSTLLKRRFVWEISLNSPNRCDRHKNAITNKFLIDFTLITMR